MEHISALLREYGLSALDRDQRFLASPSALQKVVDAAALKPTDVVLEIGAGVGNLTALLCGLAGRVYAVEKDEQLVEVLENELGDVPNVEVICADALTDELPDCDVLVSNLPYSIATPLTFRLLEHSFERAALTYQLEFAKKLIAKPSTRGYGWLTVMVVHQYDVSMVARIPKGAFYPSPRVDSAVVKLVKKTHPYKLDDEGLFTELVRSGFAHRRKKLKNALAASPNPSLRGVRTIELPCLNMRAEELTDVQLAELANTIHRALAHASASSLH